MVYVHTQWEGCPPEANSFDGKMTVVAETATQEQSHKAGNNVLLQLPRDEDSPSFKAPDV